MSGPALSLPHFEAVDGLYTQLVRMGDFMECADPRAYIRISNRLLDACIDAGMPMDAADHVEWAGEAVFRSLVSA